MRRPATITEIPHVMPKPGREDLSQCVLVGYNGHGEPCAVIAAPEEVSFITDHHHPASASLWMVPGGEIDAAPAMRRHSVPGCPDADWCRNNRCCYWGCKRDGDHD